MPNELQQSPVPLNLYLNFYIFKLGTTNIFPLHQTLLVYCCLRNFVPCALYFFWCNFCSLSFISNSCRVVGYFFDATFVACHLCKVVLCNFPSTIFAACHFFASCTVWWVFLKSNFCGLSFLRNSLCVVWDFCSTTNICVLLILQKLHHSVGDFCSKTYRRSPTYSKTTNTDSTTTAFGFWLMYV